MSAVARRLIRPLPQARWVSFRAADAVASDLQIAPRHYKPPAVPFAVSEDGWTQEGETDEWFRFLTRVGSTSLGAPMRAHTTAAGVAWPPFERASEWRAWREVHPVEFEAELPRHIAYAVRKLAAFVGAERSSVQLLAGTALDATLHVLRAASLRVDDRVLVLEGTPQSLLELVHRECTLAGAQMHVAQLPAGQLRDSSALLRAFGTQLTQLEGTSLRTAIFQTTCATTGARLPVDELVDLCASRGAFTIVDGSHAMGVEAGTAAAVAAADVFVADLHQWLGAPRAVTMLHDRRRGYDDDDHHSAVIVQSQTSCAADDFSAALAVPTLLDYWRTIGFQRAHAHCCSLLEESVAACQREWAAFATSEAGGLPPGTPFVPMSASLSGATAALVRLPQPLQPIAPCDGSASADALRVQHELLRTHSVQCEVIPLGGQLWAQLTAHVVTSSRDMEPLTRAVGELAAREQRRRRDAAEAAPAADAATDKGPCSCVVFKSAGRRVPMYVYVEDEAALQCLPPQLTAALEPLTACGVTVELRGDSPEQDERMVGGVITRSELRRRLGTSGYYVARGR